MHRPVWKRIRSYAKALSVAPNQTGVYAIAEVRRCKELPVEFKWKYVGYSKNLRRRLSEHTSEREKNRQLRNWLSLSRGIEIWYSVLPDQASALRLERELIMQLDPLFNVTHKEKNGVPND